MSSPNGPLTGRPPVRASKCMVATSHYLASGSGLYVLRSGGSAVDAIIAANAVLCVAYPHMAGLGGDGFWLIYDSNSGKVAALNASGPAASKATVNYYKENGCAEEIPTRGPLAALTVPGAVDGWRQAHEKYGRTNWRDLFHDAIHYAKNGLAVSRSLADWIAKDVPVLSEYAEAAKIYLPNGKVPSEGDLLVQTDLSKTFEQIAANGARQGFYEGAVAEEICAQLNPQGSPLSPDDFKQFQAEWVKPISSSYRDHLVYEFPPNTQGFAALMILNMLEGFDVKSWGDGTVEYYHHMAEAVKLAFADRDEWLTDPKHVDIPLDRLLSKEYAAERRKLIDPAKALVMDEVKPGIAFNRNVTRQMPGGDTCYFCAVDSDGLIVSAIQSIYHDFGSAAVAQGTGFVLQNRGSFFKLDENHPNALKPGKRTFHTLMPALMFKEGKPYLAFGTMGGEGQPQTQAAIVTRIVDFGYDVQQAIEAPRWLMGRTWGTKSKDLSLEGRISDEVARRLILLGQPVKMLSDWNDNMGHAQAIMINPKSGFLEGGADPRGDGLALGY